MTQFHLQLAPELVAADTKRVALENATGVLSESTTNADVDVDRLPFMLHRRIGVRIDKILLVLLKFGSKIVFFSNFQALRVMLLLCNSSDVVNKLKSLEFWKTLPSWLENIIRATTIGGTSKDSPTATAPEFDEKELFDNQQINRSVQLLKDVINELNAKFLKFVVETDVDDDQQKKIDNPSSSNAI